MKVTLLLIVWMILIVSKDLLAQTSTQSLEIPLYSNDKGDSITVKDSLDIETDTIDIYKSYQEKKPLFSGRKENKLGIYGVLYGEPEKIELPTIDTDDVGVGIGVRLNF